MSQHKRRAANYRRFDAGYESYGRSYNAACAERDGWLPRLRAAARLGVNTRAFDAGCANAGYVSSEWHHVGKYATPVDYYDTGELKADWKFWLGAARAYKQVKLRNSLLRIAARTRRGDEDDPLSWEAISPVSLRFHRACSDVFYLGPFTVRAVDSRHFQVERGPGFPLGAIVDKSLFNDFRTPCVIRT